MMEWYMTLPSRIDPVAFAVGDFAVRWYGLMWITAFVVVWLLVVWRVGRSEGVQVSGVNVSVVEDLVLWSLAGAIVGGRLGYVLFYDFASFAVAPWTIVWPYVDGVFVGISGMSFHGGVIGVVVAWWWFARRRGVNVVRLADFIVPAIPAGYFFGRVGNFLNDELWGRETVSAAGMLVDGPAGAILRHPSQLYEAFFEGIVLFVVLWWLRNRLARFAGVLSGLFLVGYAVARFGVEFFRAPDAHLGFVFFGLTMGQVLSVGLLVVGCVLIGRAFFGCGVYTGGK